MIAVGISGLLALGIVSLTRTAAKVVTETDRRVTSDVELRTAMNRIEGILLNANFLELGTSTEVIIIADLATSPQYSSGDTDLDGDGVVNRMDPDVDGDSALIQPPTAQWKVGYNLKDDDDDSDNRVDMRWKIYLTTAAGAGNNTLYLDYSQNEEAWGRHTETLLSHVASTWTFAFFGSENDLLSPGTTGYDLNGDSQITMAEIDAVANGGNANGRIDTAVEQRAVATIEVSLSKDRNQDGVAYSYLNTEIIPPPLYLKRRP